MDAARVILLLAGMFLLCVQPSEGWLWSGNTVDGKWSAWSAWTSCQEPTRTDLFPFRYKQRNCTNPAPENGGKTCQGQNQRNAPCEGCNLPLGMENKRIQDLQISASSSHEQFPPSYGRLNGRSAWCASDFGGEVYFQIDLKTLTLVTAIATQGYYPSESSLSLRQGRVSRYQLSYSDDGKNWAVFESRKKDRILSGNVARQGTVLNILDTNFAARFIRIYPRSFFSFICMKLEVYGCSFQCGGYLPSTPGDLLAESSEAHDVDCLWQAALPSRNVNLDFVNFNIPCSSGSVEIRGGAPSYGASGILGHYCGYESTPPPILGSTNKIWIRFQSNSSDPTVGFYALYFPSCGEHFTNNTGTIKTPNHPNMYYHNSRCTWLITVEEGKAIMLKFSSFEVEGDDKDRLSCPTDYVTIWDGKNNSAPVLGKYCNTVKPKKYICSSGNTMRIQFHADDALAFAGFFATYHTMMPNSNCTEIVTSVVTPTPTMSSTIVMPSMPLNDTIAPLIVPKPTVTIPYPRYSTNGTEGLPPIAIDRTNNGNIDYSGKKKKDDDDEDDGLTTIIIVSVFSFIVLCMIIASVTPSIIHRCEKRRQEQLSHMVATEVAMKKSDRNNEYELLPLRAGGDKDTTVDVEMVDETTQLREDDNRSDDEKSTDEIIAVVPPFAVDKDENDGNVCEGMPYLDVKSVCVCLESSNEELGCDLEYDTTDLYLGTSYEDLGQSFATEMAEMLTKFESTIPVTENEDSEEAHLTDEANYPDESTMLPVETENQSETGDENFSIKSESNRDLSNSNSSLKDDLDSNEGKDPPVERNSVNSKNESPVGSANTLVGNEEEKQILENPEEEKDPFSSTQVMSDDDKNKKLQEALSDLKSTLSQINSESGSISDIDNSKTNSIISSNASLLEQGSKHPPLVEIIDGPVWEKQGKACSDFPKGPAVIDRSIKHGSHAPTDNKDSGCSSSSECDCLPALDDFGGLAGGAETCV